MFGIGAKKPTIEQLLARVEELTKIAAAAERKARDCEQRLVCLGQLATDQQKQLSDYEERIEELEMQQKRWFEPVITA